MSIMYEMYINGALEEGKGKQLDVLNPATNRVIASIRMATVEQAEEALQSAKAAFGPWSHLSLEERISWMRKLKAACLEHEAELIDLLAQEGGKTIDEAKWDVNAFFSYFDYYSEEAKRVYDQGLPEYTGHKDYFNVVLYRPIGVVVGYLAWNVPLSNVGLKLCPAMASGCTCVLKPSRNTPLASLKIAKIAAEIGLPAGVFNMVVGSASEIGNTLSSSKIPRMITMIGSNEAGLEVVQQAGTSVKKLSLELGGNAPCIIMPDVDIDAVAKNVALRKASICGQGCANINRIYVHKAIHDRFVEKLVEHCGKIRVGWGPDYPDAMGPAINVEARDKMLALIQDSVSRGAKLVYGGAIPENLPPHLQEGAFIMPTVLDDITDDMPIARQEIFGPISIVMTFEDLDDVIRRANDTEYGLTSYLFSNDVRVIGKCAEELECGEFKVNMGGGGPNLVHAGTKQSGLGSDRGPWSLMEYYDLRLVQLKM